MRMAFIVSHPIQYYVPLYRDLAKREGIEIKVFYTWRGAGPAKDVKFGKEFAWDIPLMEGYDFEIVPNTSADPGTHHRRGLTNPDLVRRVKAWMPDVVHITGYNFVSHGRALKKLSQAGIRLVFRGDSHLLDGRDVWWEWQLKKYLLSRTYRRPTAFACVGQANRDYYRAFGVPERKIFHVPHTIDVGRFAEPNEDLEAKALAWRQKLGIPDEYFVFLYAAKLEPRKRPMELLEAFQRADLPKTALVFVGSGELESALRTKAAESERFIRIGGLKVRTAATPGFRVDRSAPVQCCAHKGSPEEAENCDSDADSSEYRVLFLPFQNQSQMPLVYRLGDILVLPSGYGETWGLAVNEAQACGRPSLVSDCVGCGRDLIREGENGITFRTDDWKDCAASMRRALAIDWRSRRGELRASAYMSDTGIGAEALINCVKALMREGLYPTRAD